MKALVDASAAFNQPAGIGRYSRNILSRLLQRTPDEAWTLLNVPERRGEDPGLFTLPSRGGVRVVTLPFSRRSADRMWFRLRLPVDARVMAGAADAVYSPDFTAPPMARVPAMITVHDLAFLTHPRNTTDALRSYLEQVVPRQVERAQRVAVVSNATKERVRRLLNVPEEKLLVARNAVDERFYEAGPLSAQERERLGLPEKYLLMLGTIEPRKNHLNALRALERSGVGRQTPLIIAGRPGWGHEAVMERIRQMEAGGSVRMLQYVPDDILPSLTAGATAMVVTGSDPALREVGGPYALYADPDDVDALAEHMRHVVDMVSTETERQQRRDWTRQFSWDSSTSTVLQSIREMATGTM
jgi:glycosyltransferase involved in cell wall biosynthesis